jgi:hypothetical protein
LVFNRHVPLPGHQSNTVQIVVEIDFEYFEGDSNIGWGRRGTMPLNATITRFTLLSVLFGRQ